MNPDREMQMEAMDEAQDEILRLTEALGAEKEAHMETAKALVACRKALREVESHRGIDKDGNYVCWIGEGTFIAVEQALSHTAGDDYVSEASVKPIVEAVRLTWRFLDDQDNEGMAYKLEEATATALEQAKLLGL